MSQMRRNRWGRRPKEHTQRNCEKNDCRLIPSIIAKRERKASLMPFKAQINGRPGKSMHTNIPTQTRKQTSTHVLPSHDPLISSYCNFTFTISRDIYICSKEQRPKKKSTSTYKMNGCPLLSVIMCIHTQQTGGIYKRNIEVRKHRRREKSEPNQGLKKKSGVGGDT